MTPQELKNSILQLAIQGRLAPQRPEEGTAEELYRQIQREKAALVKAGKIKKEKPLPEITEEEVPFEIPEGWKWVRWGSIINVVSARRVHQSDWKSAGIPFYRAREIAKLATDGVVDNELFISQELYDEFSLSGVPQPGDLMVTAVGTLGKTYIVKDGDVFYYKDASVICLENYAHICPEYLSLLMQSEMMMRQIRGNSSGTTVATLTMVRMVEYIMPLPPLAEQKRIVAKIEELLPYIERYEKAWSRLEDFNKRFPTDMQKSILQLAIQGKLVPQRPEEGTGEALYQQIQAEKQSLIRSGKLKKEKPLPEITPDEIPFDIPESWKWARIGDIFPTSSGTTPLSSNRAYYTEGRYNWVRTTDLNNGVLQTCEVKVSDLAFKECRLEIIPRQSICIAMYGGAGTIGKNAFIDFDTTINQSVCAIHPNGLCDMRYLQFYMQYYRPYWMEHASGTRKDPNINKVIIRNCLFPLPPLAEQKRIVAKLEELLPLCERLK